MTYQRIRDDEDEDLGQDEASEPIRSTDDSFRVCGCTDTAADRIGFAIREGRRYGDGGIAWYVRLQGQGETGLYIGQRNPVIHQVCKLLQEVHPGLF